MAKKSRPCVICANWKMNKTIQEATEYVEKVLPEVQKTKSTAMIAVPFTAIRPCADLVKDSKLHIGAQNMNDATDGAFTGEIAGGMIKEAGAEFVILGHSERRNIFKETNALINRKIKRALECKLNVILCIGETKEEHENNQVENVLKSQLTECLQDVSKELLVSTLILAYEPVWAIGTGLSATPEIAKRAEEICRLVITDLYDSDFQNQLPIIYGGSVNLENATMYLEIDGIDGLLIGNSALDPVSFAKIIALS